MGGGISKSFKLGEDDVDRILHEAAAIGVDPIRGSALDFGCGVGRLSLALARTFQHVTGVDVSESMIDRAREFAEQAHDGNTIFRINIEARLPFHDAEFDFALAWIVLQHQPPRLARTYLAELIRVVKPGGILVFQLPGELRVPSNSRSAWKRAIMGVLPNERVQQIHRTRTRKTDARELPMHGIRRHKVTKLVEAHGGRVVGVIEDGAAGSAWRSFHYVVERTLP